MRNTLLIPFFSVLMSACGNEHEPVSLKNLSDTQKQNSSIDFRGNQSPQASGGASLVGIGAAWSSSPPAALPHQTAQQRISIANPLQDRQAAAISTSNRPDSVSQPGLPPERQTTRGILTGMTSPHLKPEWAALRAEVFATPLNTVDARAGDKVGPRPGDSVSRQGAHLR